MQHDIAIPVASAFVTARSDSPARVIEDVVPASAPAHLQAMAPVLIEYASRARLIEIEADWLSLRERALDPNVFMDPALIGSAERAFPDARHATLLAWQADENAVRLVGLWSFSFGHVARSPLLGSVLVAPATPHAYLATPVIDREAPDRVLAAMLDCLERDAGMPNIIMLDAMALSGETMASLSRVLKARNSAPFILTRAQRPMLEIRAGRKAIPREIAIELEPEKTAPAPSQARGKRSSRIQNLQRARRGRPSLRRFHPSRKPWLEGPPGHRAFVRQRRGRILGGDDRGFGRTRRCLDPCALSRRQAHQHADRLARGPRRLHLEDRLRRRLPGFFARHAAAGGLHARISRRPFHQRRQFVRL